MAPSHNLRETDTHLDSPLEMLAREPYRFDFFQSVRLLTWAAHCAKQNGDVAARHAIGNDFSPSDEVVRFRSRPSFSFPGSAIDGLRWPEGNRQALPVMQVTFLGLFGPQGALPRHYTQLIIDRHRHKDSALRDFLDLFNHRLISLFWRAWAKQRLPIAFEEAQRDGGRHEDPFTKMLYSLVGFGSQGVRDRLHVRDATFLYYAGHFAQVRPQAVTLEALVGDYFSVPARVAQFRGQWLQLQRADQSRLAAQPSGFSNQPLPNNQLGVNVVIGQRVWSVENCFRVRLGPLSYRQFEAFTPAGNQLIPLAQLVRTYVGPEFDFDVQLILRHDEVPTARFAARGQPESCRLGWNTWINSQPFLRDADDAAFACEGLPTRD